MNTTPVKVRFPPSPTGYCHVGTARMAILNFLFAKKHDGSIVFRSEDTDRERSTKEFEEDIVGELAWLGLSWDEFYRQSERTANYTASIERLLEADKAYLSKEPSKKDPNVEVEVVRLRNPGAIITFTDVIRGDITFDTEELGDFAIARAIDDPLYHLTVVVDDAEMQITHVIRGEDHISNTPRQILIQEALGYPRPVYAHFPLHLAADRSKLSKRKGDVAVRSYREKGYLPEALFNYLATLGWTPPSGREVLNVEEMIAEFDLHDLHRSAAVFDIEKLRWFNRQYLERMTTESFTRYAAPSFKEAFAKRGLPYHEETVRRLVPLVRERTHAAEDITAMIQAGDIDFFFTRPSLEPRLIPEKKSTSMEARTHLKKALEMLSGIPEKAWSGEAIKGAMWGYATENGRGAVLWPLRYALSGAEKSPDPFTIAAIIGKEATQERIRHALDALRKI